MIHCENTIDMKWFSEQEPPDKAGNLQASAWGLREFKPLLSECSEPE